MKRETKIVLILQTIVAVIAAAAVVVSVSAESAARISARRDSCYLIRGLVLVSTPPSRASAVAHFLRSTPLSNCGRYAEGGN